MLSQQKTGGRVLAAVLIGVLVTACGSTVPRGAGQPGALGSPSGELGQPVGATTSPQGVGSVPVDSGVSAPFSGPGAGVSAGGSAAAPGGSGATNGSSSFGGGPSVSLGPAPGVTKDSITIGAEYFSGADEAIANSGIKSVTTGDGKLQTQIMVDHINKTGGVAGRKVKVVFHDYNNSNTDNAAESDGAACSRFTEDNKVFAVLSTFNSHSDNFRGCLNKRSTLLISDSSPSFDNKTLAQFPTFLPILALGLDRRISANVAGLVRQRYFTPWDFRQAAPAPAGQAKVGLVVADIPVYTRHIPQVEAELKARGVQPPLVTRVATEADIASAVLRFSSEGVSHVMFSQEGPVAGLFAAAAVNQQYYPRYAMDTKDFPQIVLENVPQHKAFNGLVGVGWSPTTDVKVPPPLGPERQKCLKIFSDRDVETTSANQVSLLVMICDVFFFFDRVASAAGTGLSTSSFLGAAAGIKGPQFSYFSFNLNLERHRDGIATVADLEYNVECDCIRYTRFGIPVP